MAEKNEGVSKLKRRRAMWALATVLSGAAAIWSLVTPYSTLFGTVSIFIACALAALNVWLAHRALAGGSGD